MSFGPRAEDGAQMRSGGASLPTGAQVRRLFRFMTPALLYDRSALPTAAEFFHAQIEHSLLFPDRIGIFAAPASANFVSLGKVSASSLASTCSAAGGFFNQNSAGYSCEKANCNGKGGTCSVHCDSKQNCAAVPRRTGPARDAASGRKPSHHAAALRAARLRRKRLISRLRVLGVTSLMSLTSFAPPRLRSSTTLRL